MIKHTYKARIYCNKDKSYLVGAFQIYLGTYQNKQWTFRIIALFNTFSEVGTSVRVNISRLYPVD